MTTPALTSMPSVVEPVTGQSQRRRFTAMLKQYGGWIVVTDETITHTTDRDEALQLVSQITPEGHDPEEVLGSPTRRQKDAITRAKVEYILGTNGRPGGRPRLYETPTVVRSASIPEHLDAWLDSLGATNRSQAIVACVQHAHDNGFTLG